MHKGLLCFFSFLALSCSPQKKYVCPEGSLPEAYCINKEFASFFELPVCLGQSLETVQKNIPRTHFDESTNTFYADLQNSRGYFAEAIFFDKGCLNKIEITFGSHAVMPESLIIGNIKYLKSLMEKDEHFSGDSNYIRAQFDKLKYELYIHKDSKSITPLFAVLKIFSNPLTPH